MKRLFINLAILTFIAWIGWFVIYPMLQCWITNGAWSLQSRSCDVGTYTIPDIVPVTHETATTTATTPGTPASVTTKKYKDLVEVTSDISKPFSSPMVISGKARGPWYFEASFPISIMDADGKIIGAGHAEATADWMTTEYVPFTATVTYMLPANTKDKKGAVILSKDNPSGLPENDDAFAIPITFQ